MIKIIDYTNKEYPQKLLGIKDYPQKIYAQGNIELLNKRTIAIIGSRRCSQYGYNEAQEFSKRLSQKGITIISGMAIGIDTAAHLGAKNELGRTIAVLGSGFNYIYPKENKELFKEILKNNGLVISEYPPNTMPNSNQFPKRNRIVSGLSEGVLIVEAMYRSGTTITAKYAKEQNKKVFCIPSDINSKTGVGTNKLIKQGAILVTDVNDILKEFKMNLYNQKKTVKVTNVKNEYKTVYNAIGNMPTNINYICKSTKVDIGKVNEIVLMLELENLVKQLPGNEVIRK